jgi:hypothetical protein
MACRLTQRSQDGTPASPARSSARDTPGPAATGCFSGLRSYKLTFVLSAQPKVVPARRKLALSDPPPLNSSYGSRTDDGAVCAPSASCRRLRQSGLRGAIVDNRIKRMAQILHHPVLTGEFGNAPLAVQDGVGHGVDVRQLARGRRAVLHRLDQKGRVGGRRPVSILQPGLFGLDLGADLIEQLRETVKPLNIRLPVSLRIPGPEAKNRSHPIGLSQLLHRNIDCHPPCE